MHLAFKGNASDAVLHPGNRSQRSVDPANLHDDAITDLSETPSSADFAAAFRNIDQVDKNGTRLDAALDEQAQRAALR